MLIPFVEELSTGGGGVIIIQIVKNVDLFKPISVMLNANTNQFKTQIKILLYNG